MTEGGAAAPMPEPAFLEPWHAQVFALTVHLNEAGHFEWPDWAARFSSTLKAHGLDRELDGGADYFDAWLETLEGLLSDLGQTSPAQVEHIRSAWETAYLTTPHGDAVTLGS